VPSRDLQSDADELIRPLVESGQTPGVVAGVLLPDGSMRFFGYGTTIRNGVVRPDGDTLFAVGSLSKGFLAAAVALQVDEGVLSWDDTIAGLAPGSAKLSDEAKQVTLLQLATHTAGMPRQPLDLQTLELFVRYLFTGESFYGHFDRDYVMNYLATFSADRRGELQYSNIGYGILGHLLTLRTGQSAEASVEQSVIRPLGLGCTGYEPEKLPCYATRAHGYAGDQPKFIPRGNATPDWQFNDLMRASAGLHSTARDLLTMASAHMNGADTQLHAALAGNARGRPVGSGRTATVAWTSKKLNDRTITYQVGLVAGYTSYIGLDIANRTAVVVLQNSFNWDLRAGHLLLLRTIPQGEAVTNR
jgi:CubicO group peptidase (beta-lactamase class C family)